MSGLGAPLGFQDIGSKEVSWTYDVCTVVEVLMTRSWVSACSVMLHTI